MTATAMNDFLQQLHDLVPVFDVASIPRDATGVFASPVHIIAGLLNKKFETIKKINEISANVNLNCTRMKVIVNGTEQRNRIMVGDAESILRVLASCSRGDITAIVARFPVILPVLQAPVVAPVFQAPVVAPVPQAPTVAPTRPQPSVAPAPQAPAVAMDVDGTSADYLQDDGDMTIQDHFDFVPAQMVEFVLELNGSKFNIPVRRDGYVNVTKICQAAGARLDNYKVSPAGKEYIEFLQKRNLAKSNTLNPGITLLTSIRGNCPGRGTYAHPDLAMAIAMWAHPPFLAEVSGWIRELLITGRVELGKEKSGPELKQKLEETFQAIDEDEKAFLREKRCLELSLLRIECSKRQRDDAAAEEERTAKRQRDDYDNAKRQRDDAVAEEERAAKRQRDDAAAEEESRMQLVRFDAEMADKAIATASLKKKEELDYNKLLVPFVEDIQNRTNDAHVKALCKDIGMALLNQAKFLITCESSATQETRFCDDVTTIGRKLGFDRVFVETHRVSLGKAVAKEYRRRNPNKKPQSTEKHVNSGNRSVFTYDVDDNEWIEDVVRQCLTKKNASACRTATAKSTFAHY